MKWMGIGKPARSKALLAVLLGGETELGGDGWGERADFFRIELEEGFCGGSGCFFFPINFNFTFNFIFNFNFNFCGSKSGVTPEQVRSWSGALAEFIRKCSGKEDGLCGGGDGVRAFAVFAQANLVFGEVQELDVAVAVGGKVPDDKAGGSPFLNERLEDRGGDAPFAIGKNMVTAVTKIYWRPNGQNPRTACAHHEVDGYRDTGAIRAVAVRGKVPDDKAGGSPFLNEGGEQRGGDILPAGKEGGEQT